jgi:4-amino-4-deoxy-L-arabinose transferase-like glycosyltransferase
MKILKKPILLLISILILAASLRTYNIGKVPLSLNWDEVALGYNAYSILKTGHDEYRKFLPVVLQSYDDYKPALYSYFDIPFIAILGLTEGAVRLPSATAGVAAVAIIYFIVLELLGERKLKLFDHEVNATTIGLVTSLFLAISPWHIQFSRIAFESNVGLTLNLLAFLLFLKALKKPMLLPLSFMVAALNIHMYQSERVFSPLLMIILSLIFFKKLLSFKKWVFVSIIAAVVVAMPLALYILTNNNALLRAKGVSVFSSQELVSRSSKKLLQDNASGNTLGKILDNRRIEFGKATVAGYISHFDLNWLFVSGDIARHHAPFMGLLYLFELPFLLIGIYFLIFLKIDKRYKYAFFAYFLLVPIPASITSGVPHAVRTLNFEGTWELFIALGCIASILFVLKQKSKYKSIVFKLFSIFYLLFTILNIFYFLNQYFVQLNYYDAKDWLYGYKQVISYVDSIHKNYDKVVVENTSPLDQSYMFFLFYLKVDPSYYQSLGGTKTAGFREIHKGFYNYVFEPVRETKEQGKLLLIGKPSDILDRSTNSKTIYYPDGTPAISIGEK